MSRGNIIATRFYKAHKRPKRQAIDEGGLSPTHGPSDTDGASFTDGPSATDGPSPDESPFFEEEASPSIELGSLDIPSGIPSGMF